MPAHTTGTAARACAPTLSAVPPARRRPSAERTPNGMPTTTATVNDIAASGTVTCALSSSSVATGVPVSSEVPRSPRNRPPIHAAYCCHSGAFRPRLSRSAAI